MEFAFEPKRHPLLLNDALFTKTTGKLSDGGKYFFTKEQLQFALSRKKMKSNLATLWMIIPAGVTSLIAFVIAGGVSNSVTIGAFVGGGLLLAWLISIVFLMIKRKFIVSLPQTTLEFESTVINRWWETYREFPEKLILEAQRDSITNEETRGILLCETQDAANCLIANQIDAKLNLAVLTDTYSEAFRNRRDLPVFVLHNASIEGCNFVQKIKNLVGKERRIIDIGLRPQIVIKSKLPTLRKRSNAAIASSDLSSEEIKWLSEGFYTPLFTLRPTQIIKYINNQMERKFKNNPTESVKKKAEAIGFMTWIGEK